MRRVERARVILLAVAVVAGLQPGLASGQAWRAPRTSWGHPDLQGVWSTATITPLERPPELAGKPFFSPEEVAEHERQTLERTNRDRRDGDGRSGCRARLQRLLVGHWHAHRADPAHRSHHRSARWPRSTADSRRHKSGWPRSLTRARCAVLQITRKIATSGNAASRAGCRR